MFPNDASAERWFVETRWPNGVACPRCGSLNIQERKTRKPQPLRCRDCRKDFSTTTGMVMQSWKLGYQTWAMAIYLMNTGIKGTSSMKLHRDLGITHKNSWHLARRIREAWKAGNDPFVGPVEVDETQPTPNAALFMGCALRRSPEFLRRSRVDRDWRIVGPRPPRVGANSTDSSLGGAHPRFAPPQRSARSRTGCSRHCVRSSL